MRTTHPFRRVTIVAMATATLLTAASTSASAVPPDVVELPIVDAFVDMDTCEFPIDVVIEGTVTIRSFFDRDGVLVRGIANVEIRFDAASEHGVASRRTSTTEHFSFDGDMPPTLRIAGLLGRVTGADGRLIGIEAGQSVQSPPGDELSFAGNGWTAADVAALCAALS